MEVKQRAFLKQQVLVKLLLLLQILHPNTQHLALLVDGTQQSPLRLDSHERILNSRVLDEPSLLTVSRVVAVSEILHQTGKEGRTIVETSQDHISNGRNPWQMQTTRPQTQTIHEDQLKASRDVAMATAAKAKLLLRELKTVKADLAFAKQRSSQLEEENKMLREAREKGDNPADDDMVVLFSLTTTNFVLISSS
uniref:Uncharacterized protein n=1 Tax=Solanum tuberosum TaxID=4113 RepID=M1CNF6_SOLTU